MYVYLQYFGEKKIFKKNSYKPLNKMQNNNDNNNNYLQWNKYTTRYSRNRSFQQANEM